MKSMKKHTRVISFILTVMMLFSIVSVSAYASDYSFAYYFADEAMTEIYVTGFKGDVPESGEVEVPDTIDGYTVIGIGEYTFYNLETLTSVLIPSTVIYIDENAFYGCNNIANVEIKNQNEIDVGEDVFDATEWYENHKQDYVISGTTLVSYKGTDEIVTIPANCTTVSDGAFKGNEYITTLYIENGVTKIGANAFAGCTNLAEINIGDKIDVLEIGADAFSGTAWLENYPGPFAVLGSTLVKYTGSESYVSIPNVITAIADGAFTVDEGTPSFKVKVPVTVTAFGDNCFYLYKSASDVYPEILVYAGSAAEDYCKSTGLNYSYALLPGDADENGTVTASDARYVLRVAAKLESPILTEDVLEAVDISGDGSVGADDARLILRIVAKLSEYSSEDLLTMPRTDYEVLLTAAKAVSLAKAYGCAYSKTSYQKITDYSMNVNTQTYLAQFKNELTSESKATTVTYNQDSQEAYDNLFDITLVDSSMIKSYSCVIEDGNYVIKIVLDDETVSGDDVDTVSATEKMFPVETVAHFTNTIKNQYWYKLNSTTFDYDMTYTDCTLELVVAIDTMLIQSMTLTMNYNFEITGKILGIGIKNSSGDSPATATRQDVVKYTSFVYFSK
ncbi:MAG: leucine-rich repeat protein [Clostridiales bacterium]|nr:leucine-rich repeat protein [Clostridiales bacterium]